MTATTRDTLTTWRPPRTPGAYIDPRATIGPRTTIGANCYIGPNVTIGANCVIQPGACIGQDGFGYFRDANDRWTPKAHPHGVVIEDDVHVGANTCIDRGSWRDTRIDTGTRIDNLVHIAHNVHVRKNCMVVAHAELSGSVNVCDGAWIGPRACIMQRVTIGPKALVGMGAVVLKDVPGNVTVAGNPAKIINDSVGVREHM